MRLLLADDHALVRGGLRALLTGLPGVTEVIEAGDGHEAIAAVAAHRPDVVLMDISMPRMNGREATPLILSIAPATRVIIISMHHDEEYVWHALRAGASGYLAKSAVVEELQEALRAVRRGEVFVSRKLQRAVTREPQQHITMRQREVLSLIAAAVYERIAAEWPDVAVIFSTGHADESRLPEWSSKHVGFLRKPYTSDVLLTKLREVV